MIGIFDRSHYEDVLIVRVHELVEESVWSRRYDEINDWEAGLVESGTVVIKCFLHISGEEQKSRLQARLADPRKYCASTGSTTRVIWWSVPSGLRTPGPTRRRWKGAALNSVPGMSSHPIVSGTATGPSLNY